MGLCHPVSRIEIQGTSYFQGALYVEIMEHLDVHSTVYTYIIYIYRTAKYILYIYQVTKHLDVLSTLYTYIIYTSDDEVYITHIHQMTKHLDIQSTVYTCIMYYIIHMYHVLHNTCTSINYVCTRCFVIHV